MAVEVIKRGSIEMLVLVILQDGDYYGYSLANEISSRSEGRITVEGGALYPLLYRMEKDGYVVSSEETAETKNGRHRSRILYHITSCGMERLRDLVAGYHLFLEGTDALFAAFPIAN